MKPPPRKLFPPTGNSTRLSCRSLLPTSFLLLAWAGTSAAAEPARPNILLVLSDDHSVPHVGCYGNKDIKTPNLGRFAAEGMRFAHVPNGSSVTRILDNPGKEPAR